MKKELLKACSAGLLMLGMMGSAQATYIETVDVYEYSVGGNIDWTHSYDFSETAPIEYATLTIVADDVDLGEDDYVYLNGMLLGALTQLSEYTNWGYVAGAAGNLTTSIFNIDASLLDWSMPISVSIESNWGVEIQTSTLEVKGADIPVPASAALLALGLACMSMSKRKRA